MRKIKIFCKKNFIYIGIASIFLNSPNKAFANPFDYEILEQNAKQELDLIKLGNNSQAIKNIEKKILKNPNDPYLFYLLGRAYKNLDQISVAEDYYKKAIKLDPTYPKLYLSYGLLKGKKGEINESIRLLDKAIELNPNYVEAYTNRGVAKGANSDNLGAIEDFNMAIKINPYLSDPYRNRGITNELIGNLKGACKDWKTAFSLGQIQAKEWYKDQCENIIEFQDQDKNNVILSLEETNKRLLSEIEALKNSSKSLETISIGDTSLLSNQETKNENRKNIVKVNKNETKPTPLSYDSLNNNKMRDGQLNSNYTNQDKSNFSNNNLSNLIFFILGSAVPALYFTLFNRYKFFSKRSNHKTEEDYNLTKNYQEALQIKKNIQENSTYLNKLITEKELIEKKIETIKYEIDYFKMKQTNLKVYTLSKYKELFSVEAPNIKFNQFINKYDLSSIYSKEDGSSFLKKNIFSFSN